jgi:hypothetical protein
MSQFTTELEVKPLLDGTWELIAPFEYHIGSEDSKETIKIKAGFTTDFASVPRIFWNIFPPFEPSYGKAAVIHDALYSNKYFTRKRSDEILLEGMKVLGASRFTQYAIYWAVRLFAGFAWNGHKTPSAYVEYVN